MTRSKWRRSGSDRRRTQPLVEGLESRRLMAVSIDIVPIAPKLVPTSIAVGSDNNLWFTALYNVAGQPDAVIGEINPATGAVSYNPTPQTTVAVGSIVSGPGGELWFLETDTTGGNAGATSLASFNVTTHAFASYPLPILGTAQVDLAVGSDGNLWFTDLTHTAIGTFNATTHIVAEFPLPNINDIPSKIAPGPDGNLWFILQSSGSISQVGDINPTTHAITVTSLPIQTIARAITAGPDGNLWIETVVLEKSLGLGFNAVPMLGSLNPTTRAFTSYLAQATGGITVGPDGNIWYDNGLGEFNLTTHIATDYPTPGNFVDNSQSARTIVTGPDGNVWFTEEGYLFSAHIIPATQAAIAGYVYEDATGSGPPTSTNVNVFLDNATVFLDLKGDGQLDPGDPIANTDALGYYSFSGLAPGTYTVRLVPYPGNISTFPNDSTQTITVTGGQLGTPPQLGLLPSSPLLPLTYDPTPFGTQNPDVQTAEVNGLYMLILGRNPDAVGGAAAVAYLKNNGSVGQLAADLLNSAEYETGVISSYYQIYLRRTGSTAEIAAWVAQMQRGVTEKQVTIAFLNSAEYSTLFPDNATFIQALYGDVLGRLPASVESSAWVAAMNAGTTRAQVIAGFLDSSEAANGGVAGLYGIIFARMADSDGQSAGVAALQSGMTLAQLATGMIGTVEYVVRANATVG